jgi:hypothetical protein
LFLDNPPSSRVTVLQSKIAVDQLWPLYARFYFHSAVLTIETDNPVQVPDINQEGIGPELLPSPMDAAHPPPKSPLNHPSFSFRSANDLLNIFQRAGLDRSTHVSRIEL